MSITINKIRITIIIFFLGFLWACSKTKDKPLSNTKEKHDKLYSQSIDDENSNYEHIIVRNHPFWYADYDSKTNTDIIIKGSSLDSASKTPKDLIAILNEGARTKIKFDKTSHDTIYVKLINDYYVTEQSGSTGAWWYIAGTTFTLTEINNINYVNYDFEEGSHLVPGVYSRETFNTLKVVSKTHANSNKY